MTLTQPSLVSVRQELPVTQEYTYLNTGSAGPLPRAAVRAMVEKAERELAVGRVNFELYAKENLPLREEVRERFARLLQVEDDEIAFTHHTTDGINIAAWGLNWQPGDEVVTTRLEHPGGLLPAYAVARRFGLTVRVLDLGLGDGDVPAQVAAAVTSRTRLAVVSHVAFKTGAVLPMAEIADVVHRAGGLLAVDGAQSAGTIPLDLHALDVDFYAIPGQKWLCGPEGMGALYVRRERQSELAPTYMGYSSMGPNGGVDFSGHYIPADSARRYEIGSIHWPALAGMRASLAWLQDELGMPWVYDRVAAVTGRCREILAEMPGVTVHTPGDYAGLTAFTVDGLDLASTPADLAEMGILLRSVREPDLLRVSTGFFNDEEDLQRLAESLRALREVKGV